jgi:ATP-dependent Clp protease ATP-binding subunit ClpC
MLLRTHLSFKKVTDEHTYEVMKEQLKKEVDKHFRPEFLNRVDNIIVFKPLNKVELKKIIEIELTGVKKRLENYNITISLTDDVLDFLIDKGYDQNFGARPLRRAIETYLEDPLSEEILQGKFEGKKHVKAKVQDGKLAFDEIVETPEPALANAESSL